MNFLAILLILIEFSFLSAEKNVHEAIYKDINGRAFSPEKLPPEIEKKSEFWIKKSQDRISELIRMNPQKKMVKNIILLIGDGMSISTITAARILKAQQQGSTTGEESSLNFEKFPYSGLAKTYCTNGQVPESSCTSTALHSGVKANLLTIGVNAEVPFNNCPAGNNPVNHVESIASWAQTARKSTGFVTTSRVTHATPAGMYAHSPNRFWESDLNVQDWNENTQTCADMARQLIRNEPGNKLNVIMGGGRSKFLPNTVQDEYGNFGERLDRANLIEEWKNSHPQGQYLTNPFELRNINPMTTDVLALFQPSHFDYHSGAYPNEQPTLSEMTESAIKILQKNRRGYFLMVEGHLIDDAHHATKARLALEETIEFDKAVETAVNLTNIKDTLIIVTSDHGHSMSFTGYPRRGNNILGINEYGLGDDLLPYTILSYANGPSQYLDATGKRLDVSDSIDPLFNYPSYVPKERSTHGGEDVSVYALGPYAHYFSGTYEQNDIPHLMAFAACIGNGRTHCRKGGP